MYDLLDWLERQHDGVNTYKALLQRLRSDERLAAAHPAFVFVLRHLAGRIVSLYEESPCDAETGSSIFATMLGYVKEMERLEGRPAAERLALLDRMAQIKLA
ncbi:hypothetical protein MMB17_02120 [Methylobacterium organophilum]|uniref:hypothetical protein n=1 Tax=Methylobacterium organophilum TaxID=410 RepID=UPI001F1401A5|nr:hypothetical protein [Methylobacterium organophilum]UMY18174.1 hypothetical protein MMB17_02120 [Methylobacterium organophilum]